MRNMTLENIAEACGGRICLPSGNVADTQSVNTAELLGKEVSSIVIDSRKVSEGSLFIATRGERVDGHSFIGKATEQGAIGAVCEKQMEDCTVPYILVKDSFKALQDIAEFYRRQLTIPVVGITGSVGKTSTKEMIASVLSQKFHVLKTAGNFNNEIGLPLTVLSIREEHEIAVLEMGISDFGEMHRLSRIAKPDICVMTNIGQCHLEQLGSRAGILKAKSEIFDYMNPDGYIIVNGDDDKLQTVQKKGSHEVIHFGKEKSDEIYATDIEDLGLKGSRAIIHNGEDQFVAEIPLPGLHMVNNALAAAAVGRCLSLTWEQIAEGIRSVQATVGRSNVLFLKNGTMIDDCYNANPVSMKAAIDLLSLAKTRTVAILGDMFELGEREKQLHGKVGAYVAEKGVDVLLCAGALSEEMYGQAKSKHGKTQCLYFPTREELMKVLPDVLKSGDSILVKASHGMHFEEIVKQLETSLSE